MQRRLFLLLALASLADGALPPGEIRGRNMPFIFVGISPFAGLLPPVWWRVLGAEKMHHLHHSPQSFLRSDLIQSCSLLTLQNPGFEDELYCPPKTCLGARERPAGFTGPR
jgi:hypothetical protein